MKRYTIACCLGVLLFSCKEETKKAEEPKVAAAATETPAKETAPAPIDTATANRNWQMYMTPSEMHKMMASWNGTWNGEVSMWMSADAQPIKSVSTGVNKMIMGGRYQQASFKGDMNGMPFEGMSTLAYDNHKKHFISTWIDNVGTGLMTAKGAWDPTTKTIALEGSMVDPASGRDMPFRENYKVIDDNFHVMEMFCNDPATGKEFKTMEIKYTRKR